MADFIGDETDEKDGRNDMRTMTMGNYKGKPVDWLVLDEQPGKSLLIAKDCLRKAPYHKQHEPTTWRDCGLKVELAMMLEEIFSEEERGCVMLTTNQNLGNERYCTPGGNDTNDLLFLLSIDEANKYFRSNKERVALLDGKPVWWWLRSTGYVYFPCCYDDREWAGYAPRNPCDIITPHQGGG